MKRILSLALVLLLTLTMFILPAVAEAPKNGEMRRASDALRQLFLRQIFRRPRSFQLQIFHSSTICPLLPNIH